MEISISAKHVTVEDEVKTKATALLNKFAEDYPTQKFSSIRVLFSAERNFQIVEILVSGKNVRLHAAAKLDSVYAALASAVDKLSTQMSRYLEKVRDASVKADPALKDKVWRSAELSIAGEDKDLAGYIFEYKED